MNLPLTVTQLNLYLHSVVENDVLLKEPFNIEGELTDVRVSGNHLYATLKDSRSQISIAIFQYHRFQYIPQNGDNVRILGKISLYEINARISILVEKIEKAGIGDLHERFEKLKIKLEKEGLFQEQHKITCPVVPLNICVVTSSTGAVRKDIETTIKKGAPYINITLIGTSVQGTKSEDEIISALCKADTMSFDAIILARGGGSFEDLNSFNSELVARTIFKMNTFIISAIGHETDFTISDFVADYRAATPTAAAEYIVKVLNQYIESVKGFLADITNKVNTSIQKTKTSTFLLITNISNNSRKTIFSIKEKLSGDILKIKILNDKKITVFQNTIATTLLKISQDIKTLFNIQKQQTFSLLSNIEILNPIKLLEKGYFKILNSQKVNVSKINDFNVGEKIYIYGVDGQAQATVTSLTTKEI